MRRKKTKTKNNNVFFKTDNNKKSLDSRACFLEIDVGKLLKHDHDFCHFVPSGRYPYLVDGNRNI